MSEDGAVFLEKLADLINKKHAASSEAVDVNYRIGKLLYERYNSQGFYKIPGIAIALTKKNAPVSADFLVDAYRVANALDENMFAEIKKRRKTLSWFELVREYSSPPFGDTKEACAYWENYLKRIEDSQLQADFIAEHYENLPDSVKVQAEGLLTSLGYNLTRKRVRRVLHTGDIHFDDNALLGDVIKSAVHLVKKARAYHPDLIVVSGDLLNTRLSHDSTALKNAVDFVMELGSISPVFLLIGTFSHDGASIEIFKNLKTAYEVYVSENIEMVGLKNGHFAPLTKYVKGLDAVIYTLPPVSKANILATLEEGRQDANLKVQDLLRDVFQMWGLVSEQAKADGVMTIVSAHGTLTGSVTSTGQKMVGKDIEFGYSDIQMAKADVGCLSHIHKAQQYGNMFYSGSIAKLNAGEVEDKGFWVHEMTETGLKSSFEIIPTRDIIRKDFEGLPGIDDLPEVTKDALVRIIYRVSEEDVHTVNEQEIRDKILALGASEVRIERSIIPKQEVRAAGISGLVSLADKFTKSCEMAGLEVTSPILQKVEMLQKPFDMVCAELGIEPPKRKAKLF
jgi:exonuclease SbcD